MTLSKVTGSCILSFALIAVCLSAQETKTAPNDLQQSCREFVQGFYDWYVPKALHPSGGPASDVALKFKSPVFSPRLSRALQEDSEAQAKVAGKREIVGIDFDPFLFGQDPCERYVLGSITRKGDSYWVEVYGVCSGKKSAKPDVLPELAFKNGRWLFVNFHYEQNVERSEFNDLVSVLKSLRESRQKPAK